MRGLAIVGAAPGAEEVRVAAAACAALARAGERPAAFVPYALGRAAADAMDVLAEATGRAVDDAIVLDSEATPLVAARLAGAEIDPRLALERASRTTDADVLVAALGGGLAAPLAERYSVRDLARELGAPVVVAAPAGPDGAAVARLTIEAAVGAGLRAAGIVLTRWPVDPTRIVLEERLELERSAGLATATLAHDAGSAEALAAAAAGWPIEEWLEPGAPGSPTAAAAEPASVVLEPYTAWEERAVGDPRTSPRPEIMGALLEIVAAEGPLTATRAFSLYNRAAGGRKLTNAARTPLSSAAHWLARDRKVVIASERENPWQGDDVLRTPDAPPVRVRALGPRTLEEVPLDEIAELVRRLRSARGLSEATELKRAVLSSYGLVRLTGRADEYLSLALDLAGD